MGSPLGVRVGGFLGRLRSVKVQLEALRKRRRLASQVSLDRPFVFVEFFAGTAVLTRRGREFGVETASPEDVITGGYDLCNTDDKEQVRAALGRLGRERRIYVHFAPPCSSFSRLRNRGARVQLRSDCMPEGIPDEAGRLPQDVVRGNALA